MQYINCKKYAQEILDAVKAVPNKKKLVILSVGDNPASQSYVKGKIKDCDYCGIPYEYIPCSETTLPWIIENANQDSDVGGIIIQLPLPSGVDEKQYTDMVLITKDVDGFKHNSPFKPCTPEGIMYVLKKELGDLTGKTALVVGKGKLVGKPVAEMLLNEGVTVTIAHSKTENLDNLMWLGQHDITITAVGKPNLVNLSDVWSDVVIDAGITRNRFGKLCGDCCGENEWSKVTPVPGGIGLMTRAMLMAHVARLDVNTIR